ncbi:type II toxin-antitoxin system HipA family toxin YjjJ [Pseudoxanthomonas sp.]|uniref:type II toxin-antitoxin system HipA family toxin YjjJ n=1 Tax=Pseudoxanthomonas sp. TaxID=1871049 RepID=UPI002633B626|nr:type II toxin-antitoxin system HipA family toxin YjjJ [Pseudoxanthomonas sp.]WDS34763.1 MAG: type II toxin-antitoxin system HipA family toxin YjjJ [Pseudoxanthomonas sp.]
MDDRRFSDLFTLLRRQGAVSAQQIAAALGVSQPTVSRLLTAAGDDVVRIGKARASRYVLRRQVARAGSGWPLFRITAEGAPETLGQLQALHGDGYLFVPERPCPALLHGEFAAGLFPGLPWFLDDQRPQGFLGRAFAKRVAPEIGASPDLTRWQPDDIVLALLRHGDNAPGDLVLGEAMLQRALHDIVQPANTVAPAARVQVYPRLADAALQGEDIGSSAGGEQPKFTATLKQGEQTQAVIVKFSERAGTPAAQRWADLLHCEHLAGQVLAAHGVAAAQSEIVQSGGRTFLQSTRFDRTPQGGRGGYVSLAALDGAYYGHGRIDWWQLAQQLRRDQWLDRDGAHGLSLYGWFGALIANTDMHLGNAGLVLDDARPLRLAPAYDMLPMAFRPAGNGEVVERAYAVQLPTPEFRDVWRQAADMALDFWQRVAQAEAISTSFRQIAESARERLSRAVQRLG